jgi:antitoxin MazE
MATTRKPTTTKTPAKLTRIGNSRGVRLPKALIEQAGLGDDLELIARDGEIIIANRRRPRAGWAEQMEAAYQRGELTPTQEELDWQTGIYIAPELLQDEDGWWEK